MNPLFLRTHHEVPRPTPGGAAKPGTTQARTQLTGTNITNGANFVGRNLLFFSFNYDNTQTGINTVNNYRYDAEGRLIRDLSEGIEEIVWRVDGKVKKIYFTTASEKNNLEFD